MATTTLSLNKLIDYTENSSFVVNKNANGSTKTFVAVFNVTDHIKVNGYTPKISSVKVGGQNWLSTEIVKITYLIGSYNERFYGFGSDYWSNDDTVSEKDGTTSSSVTIKPQLSGYNEYRNGGASPAVQITVESTQPLVGCEVVMSGFSLDVDYEPGHSYTSKVTTAATCTSAGVRTYTCSCGDSYTESIPALNHSWKAATYTWSSDGKTCTAKRVCGNNSSHTESATATITSAVRREATCTEKGTTRYTAKFSVSWASTQTKDVQDIAAKGHTWENATCIAPKSCTVCDATEGSALGHSYTGEIKSNGNGEDATHSFKCVNGCNQYGGAVKHTWNDGVITKQPTCLSYGIKTYSCTVNGCGGTYTKTIPATGHTEVIIPAVEPTCTATGLTAGKKCSVCNTILVAQRTVPALEHSPSCYPEITSVQMLYSNKQISASNKVPAGEYFRIVVGAIAHH